MKKMNKVVLLIIGLVIATVIIITSRITSIARTEAYENQEKSLEKIVSYWKDLGPEKEKKIDDILNLKNRLDAKISEENDNRFVVKMEKTINSLYLLNYAYDKFDVHDIKINKEMSKVINNIDLESKVINKYLQNVDSRVVDIYFNVKEIQENKKLDSSERLCRICHLDNKDLIERYLKGIRQIFRYNGCTEALYKNKNLILKNAQGKLKEEIENLYKEFDHLRKGKPAPDFIMKDYKGNKKKFSEYFGKIIVMDTWATWCGGCIANLPKFLKVRDHFKDNKEIQFLTLSIDREGAFLNWKYSLPRYNLLSLPSYVVADLKSFEKKYHITGIPRYMIIDKEGKIFNVYSPHPGKELEEMIQKTIDQYK